MRSSPALPAGGPPGEPVPMAGAGGRAGAAGKTGSAAGKSRGPRARMRMLGGAIVIAAGLGAVTGCAGGGPAPGRVFGPRPAARGTAGARTPASGRTDSPAHLAAAWPTFNQNAARTGVARTGVRAAGPLTIAWQARLDGAVYGQPLLIGDLVVAATENDSVYALNRSTGTVVWRSHVGTPVPREGQHRCGDIFPLGITGTPVYDQANGLVYAVAETSGYQHTLFGFSVSDGAVRVKRPIPAPDGQQAWDQQRPALTMAAGRVYVAFGGLTGDCGPYIGSVVGVPLSGNGPLVSFRTPTSREGGVWATAGPVTGPDGNLYVSIGNGAATGGAYDGSDSVTELTAGLHRTGFFAPATWADDNAHDLDLGSTQPALAADGALLIVGKRGTGYLLAAGHLGGIGSAAAQAPVCRAFGAAAADGGIVYEPCEGGGMAAVSVSADTRQIKVLWRGPSTANGSPVVGGGAVWVTDWDAGTLYEVNPANGRAVHQISLGTGLPHFSSLSLEGSAAFVGTLTGVTAVNGA